MAINYQIVQETQFNKSGQMKNLIQRQVDQPQAFTLTGEINSKKKGQKIKRQNPNSIYYASLSQKTLTTWIICDLKIKFSSN